jgi:uncharacterized protein (DUF983 family)
MAGMYDTPWRCRMCGAESTSARCEACGRPPYDEARANRRTALTIIGVLAVVVALLALGVYLMETSPAFRRFFE